MRQKQTSSRTEEALFTPGLCFFVSALKDVNTWTKQKEISCFRTLVFYRWSKKDSFVSGSSVMWREVTVHISNTHQQHCRCPLKTTCFSFSNTHTQKHTHATYELSLNPSAVKATHTVISGDVTLLMSVSNLYSFEELNGLPSGRRANSQNQWSLFFLCELWGLQLWLRSHVSVQISGVKPLKWCKKAASVYFYREVYVFGYISHTFTI